jgi:hypothetical protein
LNKNRFNKGNLYILFDPNFIFVFDVSNNIKYNIENVWDHCVIHQLQVGESFECFDHEKNNSYREGLIIQEATLLEIFSFINNNY